MARKVRPGEGTPLFFCKSLILWGFWRDFYKSVILNLLRAAN